MKLTGDTEIAGNVSDSPEDRIGAERERSPTGDLAGRLLQEARYVACRAEHVGGYPRSDVPSSQVQRSNAAQGDCFGERGVLVDLNPAEVRQVEMELPKAVARQRNAAVNQARDRVDEGAVCYHKGRAGVAAFGKEAESIENDCSCVGESLRSSDGGVRVGPHSMKKDSLTRGDVSGDGIPAVLENESTGTGGFRADVET